MGKCFADGVLSLKAGLIDLNADFDVNETGALFIGSSHGIGTEFAQTGDNGPSIFPSTSLAARLEYAPTDAWSFRFGAFDAAPNDPDRPRRQRLNWSDGTLFVGETTLAAPGGARANVGAWGYTSEFDPLLGDDKVGNNWGTYGLLEGPLYQEPGHDGQGLSAFVRAGFADDRINQFSHYLGGGVVYTGPFRTRDDDQIGLAVAAAGNGDNFKRATGLDGGRAEDYETAIELTYRAQLTEWLALQPDIRYIIDPGAVGGLRNALAVGLRVEIGRAW